MSNSAQANSCLLKQDKCSQGWVFPFSARDWCVMGEVPFSSTEALPGSVLWRCDPSSSASMLLQSKAHSNYRHLKHWKLKCKIQNSTFKWSSENIQHGGGGTKQKPARVQIQRGFCTGSVPSWAAKAPIALEPPLPPSPHSPNDNPQLLYTAGKSVIFHQWLTPWEKSLSQGTSSSSHWHFIKQPQIPEVYK